jgi:hypothetical protein
MTLQYGAYALRAGLAKLHARMRLNTPTSQGNVHTLTNGHACTHRPKSNTYRFSSATTTRESASMLRYTCISPLVY